LQLKEFSLINPKLEASLVFQAIETVIKPEMIELALEKTNSLESRQRKLTSSLVVCLVISMSYWSSDSMTTVLKNLVNGLSKQWTKLGQSWKTPVSSSITEARQRLGCQVISQLFNSIAKPLANLSTPGAFLGGLRVMAVDGTLLDVPDSQANAKVFGYPGSRKGTKAAFPKVRVVLLVEAGTHLITDALMCPDRIGERVRALKLLRSVNESMLLMWDRGFHSYQMVNSTLAYRCQYLGRVPSNVKFPYHQRWEIENTIDELKTHLWGRKTPIRSLKPREVVQEIYGWLLGHYAIRSLMFQAAQQANISPLRLGFTGTLKVIRRAIPDFQDLKNEQLPFFSHG
jgi:hypothetical protein